MNVHVFFSGCITGIAPHLPELIPFLINSLSEKRVSTVLYDLRFSIQNKVCFQFKFHTPQVSFIQNKNQNDLYRSKMPFQYHVKECWKTHHGDGRNSFQNESHTSVMWIALWYNVMITVFHAWFCSLRFKSSWPCIFLVIAPLIVSPNASYG